MILKINYNYEQTYNSDSRYAISSRMHSFYDYELQALILMDRVALFVSDIRKQQNNNSEC